MDEGLMEELDYEIDLLIKSGFFSEDEILEIIEDEFIDEDMDLNLSYKIGERFSQLTEGLKTSDDFIKLDTAFKQLTLQNIICIHNAGFDIQEGIQDSFELHTHRKIIAGCLKENGFSVRWNETVDEQIVIDNFEWKKAFDERQYSMDGAFEDYVAVHKE